jgi:hypothetical protein
VSRQDVTACFMLASVANCLLNGCFLRGPKRWKSLGPMPPTGLVTGSALQLQEVVNHVPYSLNLVPGVIFEMSSYNF